MSKAEIEFAAENAEKLDDLISRSAVLEMAFTAICSFAQPARVVTVHDINRLPAVDAVEVVRCRDCVNWAGDPEKKPEYAGCWRYGAINSITVHENGFCDKGKRRTADEN